MGEIIKMKPPIPCSQCDSLLDDDIKYLNSEGCPMCEDCFENTKDCLTCQGTGIGSYGPDTKCSSCGGRGYK